MNLPTFGFTVITCLHCGQDTVAAANPIGPQCERCGEQFRWLTPDLALLSITDPETYKAFVINQTDQ